jgi:hypothetical protein
VPPHGGTCLQISNLTGDHDDMSPLEQKFVDDTVAALAEYLKHAN